MRVINFAVAALALTGMIALPVPSAAATDNSYPTSQIQSPESGGANLRACPSLPSHGTSTNACGVIDWLPNGTPVRMVCSTDGNAPIEGLSPRWFWVTLLDGLYNGYSGYVWSELVAGQTRTNQCDGHRYDYAPAGPKLRVEPGQSAPSGFRYAITLTGYPAHKNIIVTCHDSADPAGFWTFTITTDAAGSAYTDRQCWSGAGPNYWVTADGVASSAITW
ncbi:SH3 domain-containing protein [Solwaraspora sp. WMMB762]|uniref:SH3 domain-containing protein n=1 Tax=Solwaraspora sp. WMMB762 TaxID=3404120 RepID=UPI003B946875